MDYKEEQDSEFEALEAIYSDELTLISTEPYCFDVSVKGSNEDRKDDIEISMYFIIRFTLVECYPDESPLMEIDRASDEMDEKRTEMLVEHLQEVATENLGMVMVFTLVSAAQDMLLQFVDDIKKEIEDKKHAEYLEAKRLDELKYKGTPVTLENFLAWKIRFDEEMRMSGKCIIVDSPKLSKKLTGKQLFERDSSMNVSDVQFLTETGVKVDESLFQDLDDLDLDDLDDLDDDE